MNTTEHAVNAADRAAREDEARAVAEIERARAELPALDPAAFTCYLGELVGQVAPDTEADQVGILASLLCVAGVYLGPGPHVPAGDDRHPLLVWPLVIGRTSAGRKGASWSTARRLLVAADAQFMTTNVRSGLTSGEGLAAMFAEPDPQPDPPTGGPTGGPTGPEYRHDVSHPAAGHAGDPAPSPPSDTRTDHDTSSAKPVTTRRSGRPTEPDTPAAGRLPPGDRRLLVFEAEWAAVMARMRREGNSLSATLRAAWEGGDLSTLNVAARIAPTSHIGVLAHITPGEFRDRVSTSDMAGGTYNRFLPVAVARSKFLPLSQGADPVLVDLLGAQLRDRLVQARRVGMLGITEQAATLWKRLYVEFSTDTGDHGPVEQFVSRAAPNCLRIAALHAALDGAHGITAGHLAAAAALVRYSIESARSVFTDNPALARLAGWITEAGPIGRTRKEITTVFYQGHAKASDIQAGLDRLITAGRVSRTMRPPEHGRGRPTEVYTADPANDAN
jgi:Protein of unknown function (DUF3987)